MNRMIIIALLWCFSSFPSYADKIYQWVDESGTVHFSDRPQAGATELQVEVTPPVAEGPLATPKSRPKKSEKSVSYKVEVLSPSNEETIRNNDGSLSVSSIASPKPVKSLGYKIVLDGIPQGNIQDSGNFNLTNVERGAHTIVVQLVDRSGKEIASSKPITVFLHRASANSPSSANAGGG